jgi:DNA-binding CsgD family transcriptional regulator
MQHSYSEDIDRSTDLATLWHQLCDGDLFIKETWCDGGRCYATVQAPTRRARPSAKQLHTLERVLVGESQKSVAIDLNVSVTTVATAAMLALSGLMTRRRVSRAPILLVAAALAARGLPVDRCRFERRHDDVSWTISIAVPGETLRTRLSPAEAEVAVLSIQGASHQGIAQARGTSVRTVANQLASVFGKIGVHGRSELRAHAVTELSDSQRRSSTLRTTGPGGLPPCGAGAAA